MEQDHLSGAGGLGKVVGRQTNAALRRGQAQGLAHGPREERIGRGSLRPDPLFKAGQDQPVCAHQAGLNGSKDAQTWMGGPACADGLIGQQALNQGGGLFGRDRW